MLRDNMRQKFLTRMNEATTDMQIKNQFESNQVVNSQNAISKKTILVSLIIAIVFVIGFELIASGTYPYTLTISGLFLAHQILEYFM